MHNGVFTTLTEVIQFYSSGLTGGATPEVNNTAEVQYIFGLTPGQEVALEAFLGTLSDQ
jgi:cytochrome c peroxidase